MHINIEYTIMLNAHNFKSTLLPHSYIPSTASDFTFTSHTHFMFDTPTTSLMYSNQEYLWNDHLCHVREIRNVMFMQVEAKSFLDSNFVAILAQH